jgi:glycosyltransferase involved in cell wall biosynthesis
MACGSFFNSILVELVYPYLLRRADLVLVQHEGQRNILLKRNIKSTILYNLFELNRITGIKNGLHKDFVYVGWLDKRKGFMEFYELVCKSPDYTFKVIGPPRDETGQYYFEKLKSFPNVTLLGELESFRNLIPYCKFKSTDFNFTYGRLSKYLHRSMGLRDTCSVIKG